MKYEKWSFGYWCLKQYVIFADWLIYKKIIIAGKNKIPRNKPIVFAPNHQNALSDSLAVLLHTRFQPVWLGRADIFKSKPVAAILRFIKIMPAYRIRDGKENLAKNDKTFNDSIKVLENNSALALFPEAAHSGKRQMLAHKKAVSRIVFLAEEKTNNNLDIQVIPTGIYYSHYWKFNRSLILNFGDPIQVKDFLKEHEINPQAAILSLRKKIHDALLQLTINFNTKKYYNDFEKIREIYGNHFRKRNNKKNTTLDLFKSDQKLANKLDQLEAEKPEATENIIKEVNHYSTKLKKLKIRNWLVDKKQNKGWKIVLNIILFLVGLPIFIYGTVLNSIPFFLIDRVTRKKVKDTTFWSTFFLVGGIIVFPLIYILQLIIFAFLLPGIWMKAAFLASIPITGKLAFNGYILLRKTIGRIRIYSMKWFRKESYNTLLKEKESLFGQLDRLISI